MSARWQPQAIIFDMDGLLVDSEPVWQEAETAMLAARGVDFDLSLRAQLVGLRMDEFIARLREIYGLRDSLETLCNEVTERMLELIPTQVAPQPGAAELLAYVVEHDIPRAIASSSPLSVIDAIVESQGWGDVFAVRCTAEDEARGKPAPDVYLTAARRLSVSPRSCLALEDSPSGARAAVAAGMVCYAVPDRSHTRTEAFDGITTQVFDSLHAVLKALKDGAV